jgi:PRC-barrel domain
VHWPASCVLPGSPRCSWPGGIIEDVLVNIDNSHVSAVILSVGGFLGMGDKLVAIPVSQLKIGSEAKFATDLTKEQLAQAPAFDFGKLK